MNKYNQTTHVQIPLPSGRILTTTIKKGIVTVESESYNNNFNTNK